MKLRGMLSSLKVRLALTSVSVIGLSVGLTVMLVTRDIRQRAERSIEDSTLDVDNVSQTIASRLINRELALSRAAAQWPAQAGPDWPAAAAFLSNQSVLTALFSRVFLADANGRVLAEIGEAGVHPGRRSIKGSSYFEHALKAPGSLISASADRPDGHPPDAVLTVTIRDPQGRTLLVLGGVLRPQSDNLLTDSTRANASGRDPIETIISDASGRILSHPDPAWLQRDAGQEPRLSAAVARWRAEGAALEPQAWTWRLGPHFVAMAAVPEARWMVFRVAPADQMLGGPVAARREAIVVGSAVAVAGALLILLVSAWLLRPMRLLEQRALRLLDEGLALDAGWPSAGGEIGHLAGVFRHVLAQRAASQRSNEEWLVRMRAVLLNAPVGIAFTRDQNFELVSRHLGELLGYSQAELTGASQRLIFGTDEAYAQLCTDAAAAFDAGLPLQQELELRRRDGRHLWVNFQGAAVCNEAPAAGTIWIVSDISERRRQHEQLSWTATHDALTDLVNRREFEARLQLQLRERRRQEVASALFIDLDGFKAVNDGAGHAAGDAVLKDVAAILTRRVRDGDTVARLGGDEFAVLLRRCDRGTAQAVAEQIRARIAAHRLSWQGQTLQVGASIGVVEIDDGLSDVAAVLAAADAACYAAKRGGRNRVQVYPLQA